MTLYRAFAYQSQLLDTPAAELQPEVMVFFEAATAEASGATLLRLLGLAWGCTPADVDFYNLESEHELRRMYGDDAPGDAALWVSGSHHGPLFQDLDRVLVLVRPLTLRRLLAARQAAVPLAERQRAAARAADCANQARQRQRGAFMADLAQMLHHQPRAGV